MPEYSVFKSSIEVYCPWETDTVFESYRQHTVGSLVTRDRIWILYSLARQAAALDGCWYECGVYRGGTAEMLAVIAAGSGRRLHLFDTFQGMPETDRDLDKHGRGDFSDTGLAAVKDRLCPWSENIELHPGFIPDTFAGRENDSIALAHVDVDIHQSVSDCCAFIYPRLLPSGIMVFDDYGFASCPGARVAVDEFCRDKPEVPLILPTGQAVIFRAAI